MFRETFPGAFLTVTLTFSWLPSFMVTVIVAEPAFTPLTTPFADTVARFGTRGLAATALFVGLGLVRYLFLVYGRGDVGRPEKILLSDRLMWLILAGYVAGAVFVLAVK